MKQLMAIGVAAAVSAGASAQDAVQWRVVDGGNGHWYLPVYEFVSSPTAHAAAVARGGYLATFLSAQENAFIAALGLPFSNNGVIYSYWIGGIRTDSSSPWTWATGEPWTFSNFDIYEPNGCCGSDVRFLVMRAHPGSEGRWDDTSVNGNWDGTPLPFIIEYSADCNADGLVDYGQIRAGQLVDANGNNIPDCCENGGSCCPGDTNNDRRVDGIDLATVLTRWGMPGAKFPQADCNADGAIDGTDLAIVLAGWGGCA